MAPLANKSAASKVTFKMSLHVKLSQECICMMCNNRFILVIQNGYVDMYYVETVVFVCRHIR